MDLTHCKHNVPMEVECMACESDEANNAGAGIPPAACACGETAAPFPYQHNRGNCLIDGVWVPAETFTRPPGVLVRQLVELQGKLSAKADEVARLVQAADDYRLAAEKAQRQADDWRSAALSLARAVGSYAETGRLA